MAPTSQLAESEKRPDHSPKPARIWRGAPQSAISATARISGPRWKDIKTIFEASGLQRIPRTQRDLSSDVDGVELIPSPPPSKSAAGDQANRIPQMSASIIRRSSTVPRNHIQQLILARKSPLPQESVPRQDSRTMHLTVDVINLTSPPPTPKVFYAALDLTSPSPEVSGKEVVALHKDERNKRHQRSAIVGTIFPKVFPDVGSSALSSDADTLTPNVPDPINDSRKVQSEAASSSPGLKYRITQFRTHCHQSHKKGSSSGQIASFQKDNEISTLADAYNKESSSLSINARLVDQDQEEVMSSAIIPDPKINSDALNIESQPTSQLSSIGESTLIELETELISRGVRTKRTNTHETRQTIESSRPSEAVAQKGLSWSSTPVQPAVEQLQQLKGIVGTLKLNKIPGLADMIFSKHDRAGYVSVRLFIGIYTCPRQKVADLHAWAYLQPTNRPGGGSIVSVWADNGLEHLPIESPSRNKHLYYGGQLSNKLARFLRCWPFSRAKCSSDLVHLVDYYFLLAAQAQGATFDQFRISFKEVQAKRLLQFLKVLKSQGRDQTPRRLLRSHYGIQAEDFSSSEPWISFPGVEPLSFMQSRQLSPRRKRRYSDVGPDSSDDVEDEIPDRRSTKRLQHITPPSAVPTNNSANSIRKP
ncbi:hypothetical protein K504DRAFT_510634 [Pleomassaria siparia CBS 279.74]|uniref:Uncharacterized protein n=1 Tax=Pleomassaria siparia CBS 279.74 TaxID=1314801 RepID=A0A6G1KRB5_9PLEO|nr:hypothetical protein K504DRAFT_510634 [Pleomassaria siparia CBS 279.74]